jgi:hypothetical protein
MESSHYGNRKNRKNKEVAMGSQWVYLMTGILVSIAGGLHGINLYYPSPNVERPASGQCNRSESLEEIERETVLEGDSEIDWIAEEQYQDVSWAARRDELSDDLSR